MTACSGHAFTYAPDPQALAPQQRIEAVIGHLIERAGAERAQVRFRRPFDTLEAEYLIVL